MIPSQLPVFIDVVQQGSFSAASRKLGVSPAAISKAISQLEKQLQQRLFHRTTHSLTLTEEGRALYDRTAELVTALDESVQLSVESASRIEGKIKINLPVYFGQTVVYPKLLAFMRRYPDVEMDLHFDDRACDLVENGFDLGVGNRLNEDSRLVARRFYALRPICICSKTYAEQHGVPQVPSDLYDHNCINYRSPTSGRIHPWNFVEGGELVQIMPRQRLVVNNPKSAFMAAQAGAGLAVVGHNYLSDSDEAILTVLDDFEPPSLPVWLYYPSRLHLSARVRRLIEFLLDEGAAT